MLVGFPQSEQAFGLKVHVSLQCSFSASVPASPQLRADVIIVVLGGGVLVGAHGGVDGAVVFVT